MTWRDICITLGLLLGYYTHAHSCIASTTVAVMNTLAHVYRYTWFLQRTNLIYNNILLYSYDLFNKTFENSI